MSECCGVTLDSVAQDNTHSEGQTLILSTLTLADDSRYRYISHLRLWDLGT